MFKALEGWSVKIFANKLLQRLIAPTAGFIVGAFTKIAPETVSQQGQETVQVVAGFLTLVVVEWARNVLKFGMANKAAKP